VVSDTVQVADKQVSGTRASSDKTVSDTNVQTSLDKMPDTKAG
jgi:hypothetical protein